MNNKLVGVLIGVIVLLLLVLAFFVGGDNSKSSKSNSGLSDDTSTIIANLQSESEAVTDEEKGEFAGQINVTQFDEYFNQEGGKTLVLVARPTCSYCELVEPVIRKIIKDYNVPIYYLNTDEFSDDDSAKFLKYNEEDWSEGFGTPMFLMVGDGKILDMIDGATDTAHFKEFLTTYEFIKE